MNVTPKPDRREQRRTELLEAAFRVFARDGFAAAKIDDVAAEAGSAKGTVYLYFSSKEELFEEVIRAKLLPMLEHVEALIAGFEGAAEDLLRQQIRFMYREIVADERRTIMRLVISEAHHMPEIAKLYHDTILVRALRVLRKTIDYGVGRGEFRRTPLRDFPMMVMSPAMIAGLWTMLFSPYHPIDLEDYAEAHIEMVLAALRA